MMFRVPRHSLMPKKTMNVRTVQDAKEAEKTIHIGPNTFILIYADWCGPCQEYQKQWSEMEKVPNRTSNIMKVHHDMVENVPTIKDAKIDGYPSVIQVSPSGEIREYKTHNKTTNSLPHMRDMVEMIKELTAKDEEEKVKAMTGGAVETVAAAFLGAFQKAGPLALLLAAHESLPAKPVAAPSAGKKVRKAAAKKSRTFKSPKQSSRRGSTRKNRRV